MLVFLENHVVPQTCLHSHSSLLPILIFILERRGDCPRGVSSKCTHQAAVKNIVNILYLDMEVRHFFVEYVKAE